MTSDQLITEFETFQGELKSFLLRMTASVQDAEHILQDTYVKAHTKIDSFRGEASLKTWIFSIASNLSGAAELRLHHLEHNRQIMEKYLGETG
jgi:RNA polymerase sigma-70 factor, ECF subfamily